MAMETRIVDYLDFLGGLGAANAPYFLEGGQAVNFWAEYFSNKGAGEALEQYRPFTSKDCDLWVISPRFAAALRPKFREVARLLTKMDRIVLRFRKTEAGANFAAAWKNARIIRDLGTSTAPTDPTPPTA